MVGIQWVAAIEVVKILDINLHGLLQCRDMPKMTLLGDAKRPKVADAVIEAQFSIRTCRLFADFSSVLQCA